MAATQPGWKLLTFSRFDASLLVQWLQLRQAVFIVEQNCAYPDIDGRDAKALHLLGFSGDSLVAGARLFAPEGGEVRAQIGRVVVSEDSRGSGLGNTLMQRAINACLERWPESGIKIGAQAHLERFYTALGFNTISAVYDEDGIPHIDMEYRPE